MNHGIKIEQLEQKINDIVNFVIEIAKNKQQTKILITLNTQIALQIQKNLIC
ncbi:hypothetical protein [Mycoplasmopsis cynos]|uniref:hypothetical protein n=1 Tax=Mycoplasmopsis cynos TaxID=171284 RepID=UPI00220195D3|nr:hypothetical protein [Mycoplasmopsis cynos]UWV77099.1 hypothetical protein NW070_04985 [Mycoplasmopsis cynos]